ncbi:MAG: hypothetical protein Q8N44_20785 [Rubrivivax sp.]|nr:hypothetical protein [Rubrivivax sp.]
MNDARPDHPGARRSGQQQQDVEQPRGAERRLQASGGLLDLALGSIGHMLAQPPRDVIERFVQCQQRRPEGQGERCRPVGSGFEHLLAQRLQRGQDLRRALKCCTFLVVKIQPRQIVLQAALCPRQRLLEAAAAADVASRCLALSICT